MPAHATIVSAANMPIPAMDQSEQDTDTAAPLAAVEDNQDVTDGQTPDDNQPLSSSGEGEHTDPKDAEAADAEPSSLSEAIEAALKPDADPETPDAKAAEDDDPDAADANADDGSGDEAPNSEAEDDDTETPDDQPDDDPTEDELKAMRPNARRRVQQLLADRKEARAAADELRPDAESFREVRQYMAANRLEHAEVADLFKLGADLKSGDPARLQAFLTRVEPFVQQARAALGHVVPEDLHTQVEQGEMTEAVAQELGRARHAAALAAQQAQMSQTQAQQAQSANANAQIVQAIGEWQASTRASDPDFEMKAEAVQRFSKALVAERGHPTNPADAVAMAEEAYNQATKFLRQARPQPKPTRRAPSTNPGAASSKSSGVNPEPTSLSEAINLALGS